jgi:hypothetical protein
LRGRIRQIFDDSLRVHSVRKVPPQWKRECEDVVRYTVARLMRAKGLQDAVRGKLLDKPSGILVVDGIVDLETRHGLAAFIGSPDNDLVRTLAGSVDVCVLVEHPI